MQRSLACLIVTALCFLAIPTHADESGATSRPAGRHLRLPGTVTAAAVEIRVPADGTIDQILVNQGQRVKRGELLFKMDTRREQIAMELAQARLASANASFDLAKTTLAASKQKQNSTALIETDARKAEADVKAAEAMLTGAKLDMHEKTLLSPMDGVLTDCAIQPGQFLRKGAALTTVLRIDQMNVEFQIPAGQIHLVSAGQEVQIYASNDRDDPPLLGKIDYVAPRVNRERGTVLVKTLFLSAGKLLDGMPVTVEIPRRP